jgi:CheY-like chemotaxis protein
MPSPHAAVLLVDDSTDTLEMYALGLSFAGYRPLTAVDSVSALGQVQREHPDVVVTDLQFPDGRGGWELIRALKGDVSTRQIPIIVLTGRTDPSIAVDARNTGCAAVIMKPCLPTDLAHVVERVLRHDTAAA